MQRRSFLSLCIGTAAAASGVALGVPVWLRPWLDTDGSTVFPGVKLTVTVGHEVRGGGVLALMVERGSEAVEATTVVVTRRGDVDFVVPYPFDELAAGRHDVSLCLKDRSGRVIDRLDAGAFHVKLPVFSA